MWGNKTTSDSKEQNLEARRDVPSEKSYTPPTTTSDSQVQTKTKSIIGNSLVFEGSISGQEDLTIRGQIRGTINLKDNLLTVGKSGYLEANILAKRIEIEGEVVGDIYAHQITVHKSGNVRGNIISPRVTIEDGARFKGSIDMDNGTVEEKLGKLATNNAKVSNLNAQDNNASASSTISIDAAKTKNQHNKSSDKQSQTDNNTA